jgi:glycosyltransferase involved in cell wall biosynthesis
MIAPFATQPKGTTRARVLPLATVLAGQGHRVTVLVPPWDNPEEANREIEHGSLRVTWLPLPSFAQVPRLSWWLARWALREKPEIVHIFKPKAHSGLALFWLWLRRSRIPRVLDSDDWEGRGGWNEVNPYSRVQQIFFQWQETFLPRRCVDVVTVASRTLQTQMWGLGLSPQRVCYLPNGVSQARYTGWADADAIPVRMRLGLGGDPVVLLYTRFDRFDLDRVVEVMLRVVARIPDTRLLVVGRGFFGEEKELEEKMAARGLGSRLVYAGWIEEKDLPAYLAAGDVAFFPVDDTLINRASCSAKLLELMVSGRAIVTDTVGENQERLEHRISGWLTSPGHLDAQAAALVALLKNASIRQSLGDAAQRRVWKIYDWGRLSERVVKAYQMALRLRMNS